MQTRCTAIDENLRPESLKDTLDESCNTTNTAGTSKETSGTG
jgi:hypothetical protein